MSFKLAFTRAVKQLSKVVSESRAVGTELSIPEAFVRIRVAKTRTVVLHEALKEPTRKMLASNLAELSERLETVTKQSAISQEEVANQVRGIDAKLNALFGALGVAPPPPPATSPAPSPPQRRASTGGLAGGDGWLGSLMA